MAGEYVVPQTRVFNEQASQPVAQAIAPRAVVIGGHAFLTRFAETDEKELGELGAYDNIEDAAYIWPNRPAGAVVDQTYTKVYVENALLQYFEDEISAESMINRVAGSPNRVRSATISFAENTDSFPRSAALLDRDVKIGDAVKITVVDEDTVTQVIWTYVKNLIADEVAAVTGAATHSSGNQADISDAASYPVVTKLDTLDNCITVVADDASYNGLASGRMFESYEVLVTESSSDGDATTARLRVISASGEDDQEDVIPSAFGVATPIGTRGATITFDDNGALGCSESAEADDIAPYELVAGQRWQVDVAHFDAVYTRVTLQSGGTYSGEQDGTLIATVTRGGLFAGVVKPQITVSMDNGYDHAPPVTISAAATDYPMGNHDVTLQFPTGTGLRLGDQFLIPLTAVSDGAMKTIELGHSFDSTIPDGAEVGVELFIRVPELLLPKERFGAAPLVNWEQSATEITLKSGATVYHDEWTDDGVPVALPVMSGGRNDAYGIAFVEYRAWRTNFVSSLNFITDIGNIGDIAGATHEDNPLKYGVYCALQNNNGNPVGYLGVADPSDLDSWTAAIEKLVGRKDVHFLCPLSDDEEVLGAVYAHVQSQSSPEKCRWRRLWRTLNAVPTQVVVDATKTSDLAEAMGTIGDDPDTSGTQYTILTVTSANAELITLDAAPNDVLRINYTDDGFGNEAYDEYVVDAVLAENQLRLVSGPATALVTPIKFEIHHPMTATEEAIAIGEQTANMSSGLVSAVWPDYLEVGSKQVRGWYACCALAAEAAGILPQQGMTNMEVAGFTDVTETERFNSEQLDEMAGRGVHILTKSDDGLIITRHGISTAAYADLENREEMMVRNIHSVNRQYYEQFRGLVGIANITPRLRAVISTEFQNLKESLKSSLATELLGGQILDAELQAVKPAIGARDRLLMYVETQYPVPLNNLDIHNISVTTLITLGN